MDALCTLPSSLSPSTSIIATGSSDGLVRLVQLFPTKVLGVVADHGEFPVERIKMDMGGDEGLHSRWLGSVSHDEVLRMTDLGDALEDSDGEGDDKEKDERNDDDSDEEGETEVAVKETPVSGVRIGQVRKAEEEEEEVVEPVEEAAADSDDEPAPKERKKKKRKKSKADKKAEAVASQFFSGL